MRHRAFHAREQGRFDANSDSLVRHLGVASCRPPGSRRRRILHFDRKLLRQSRRSLRVLLDSPCPDFTQRNVEAEQPEPLTMTAVPARNSASVLGFREFNTVNICSS